MTVGDTHSEITGGKFANGGATVSFDSTHGETFSLVADIDGSGAGRLTAELLVPGFDLYLCATEGGCSKLDILLGVAGMFPVAKVGTAAIKLGKVTKGGDDFVDLASSQRRKHILDGDTTGGGHRPGTGKPGKSEFPAGRSDDSIMHDISDIATDPNLTSRAGRGGRTITDGTRNGVDIRVVQERNGDIVTGFPTNTPRNPR